LVWMFGDLGQEQIGLPNSSSFTTFCITFSSR